MTKKIFIIFIILFCQLNAFSKAKNKSSRKPAQYISCPSVDEVSTTSWREELIRMSLNGQHLQVQQNIEKCFSSNPNRQPACIQDVYDYVNQKVYNFGTTEKEVAHSKYLSLQSESELPPEFLVRTKDTNKVLPGYLNFPENILDISKQKGWLVLNYRTRSSGGFDSPPNLTIVAIPNMFQRNIDVYLQISPAPVLDDDHHESNVSPNIVSPHIGQNHLTIITVDKNKSPPEGNLRLLDKVQVTPDQFAYKWTNESRASSCVSCHTNPLRPISPRGYSEVNPFLDKKNQLRTETPLTNERSAVVEAINNLMEVRNLSWPRPIMSRVENNQTKLIRARTGPNMDSFPYGWAPPKSHTRTPEYIQQCSAEANYSPYSGFGNYKVTFTKESDLVKQIRYDKVKQAMNCSKCHDSTRRGYLHSDFSQNEISFKILVDKRMPPWDGEMKDDYITPDTLTMAERQALVACLIKEHKDPKVESAWKASGEWMRKYRCSEETNRKPSSIDPITYKLMQPE